MKLTLFGATGGLGQEIIRQALAAGHHVTAVVRDPAKLAGLAEPTAGKQDPATPAGEPARLVVVAADVMDPIAIKPAVDGADAVVCALGAPEKPPPTVRADGIASIIEAMAAAGVERLVAISASGHARGPGDGPMTKFIVKPMLARMLRHGFADMRRMEDLVTASGLEWTIVRPPMLTNGRRGKYRTEVNRNVRGGIRVSRANLADFILRSLTERDPLRATVSIGH